MAQKKEQTNQILCPECDIGPFTRNHYFTGKLLVERDFTDEQRYYIEKLRHHHQRLHGWGVVCGLKVKQHENSACRDRFICIEPGTAIDCCGHEILVREEECIDITQLDTIKTLKKKESDDPDGPGPHILQICIRYRECPTEEIPVLYDECGCDDTQCAPNRILESYDVDVIVDPTKSQDPVHSPKLEWENTVNIAHASLVALHDNSHRLYVMTDGGPSTLYQVSTDNHAIELSRSLNTKGLALAVSNYGNRLYVVVEPTINPVSNPRQLLVFDTSVSTSLTNPPIHTLDIPNSADSDVYLAVAPEPDNRLLALVAKPGNALIWETDINSGGVPANPTSIPLGTDLCDIVIGSDGGHAYVADPTNHRIQVVDIATKTAGTPITVLPGNAEPSALAVVISTAPDLLAVSDHTNKRMYLVGLNPPSLVGSVNLGFNPVALVASPGGHWVYVLERDGANPDSYLQSVNLHRLQQGLPVTTGAAFKLGNASQGIVISNSGQRVYVPYLGDIAVVNDGGVAILDVSEEDCCNLWWRHLDGCQDCEEPNCVVLTTIENYHLGDRIENQTDPPADPVTDSVNHIARIDNRKGRRLLPSTQMLADMLECICESGIGGGGMQGPPGPPGKDGLGIDAVQANIVDCNQPGSAQITGAPPNRTLVLDIPRGCDGAPGLDIDDVIVNIVGCDKPGSGQIQIIAGKRTLVLEIPSGCDTNLTHICGINWRHSENITQNELSKIQETGLLIAFDRKVRNGDINRHSFMVLTENIDDQTRTICWCELTAKQISGVNLNLGTGPNPGTCEILGIDNFPSNPDEFVNGAQFLPDRALQLNREYRVILKGDFIRDEKDKGVDGNHLPLWLPKRASGDGVEGGTFESWFSIRRGVININTATINELVTLPGVGEALAGRIITHRSESPFERIEDLLRVPGIGENLLERIRNLVTVD